MPDWLIQGDKIPPITLNLVDGGTLTLPDDTPDRYVALMFYRGNW
jgi:peroxiredoxin